MLASSPLLTLVTGASTLVAGAGASGSVQPAAPAAAGAPSGARCLHSIAPGAATTARARTFAAAARTYGLPRALLLGVSYLESRWDNHGTAPSVAGGYGPMHLTDVAVPDMGDAKGDGSAAPSGRPVSLRTARLAARLISLPVRQVETQGAANVCGGAAVLATYQRRLGSPVGSSTSLSAWHGAVARYSGAVSRPAARAFAARVFAVISAGASRTTNDGQRVRLAPHPALHVPRVPRAAVAAAARTDCPSTVSCSWVPAPYVWYNKSNPSDYGNHDLANRPADMPIDYIVIHDLEGRYRTALQLVTNPRYVSWNYTIRSRDGHIAQHLRAKNVGWHAGNWYINMHAIGIEHEGYAASGGTWYTEAMYRSSAALVRYLAHKYSIPLDRAHIIGHDQVPGGTPGDVAGMHWDPGPYWNWQHYMQLLGAPIKASPHPTPHLVTVKPGFTDNRQLVTGCNGGSAPCRSQGTNFIYLHTAPSKTAPLVNDIGLHGPRRHSSTAVWDIGARAAAGQKLVVAKRSGAWRKVWWLGGRAWLFSPRKHPTVVPASGRTVSLRPGETSAPVFGRAYPEASAYPRGISPQPVERLQYTIKRGQSYVLADASVPTDYFYARTYRTASHTVVEGHTRYYEIWFGHRMAYVKAADVVVK